jgi:hypothetical protein
MVLSLFGPGCTLVRDATCLTVFEVKESAEDFWESFRDRRWAAHAWAEVVRTNPGVPYSEDYARGFKDGYAYYLFRGGNGEPPLLPTHYRTLAFQTPAGYQAIADWYAGFRHGAYAERQRGSRQWITGPPELPSSRPLLPHTAAGPAEPVPAPSLPQEVTPLSASVPPKAQPERPSVAKQPPAAVPAPGVFNNDCPPKLDLPD